MDTTPLSMLWILLCSGLVALMQAGFLCLETGFTRSKNNINVAVKNVADFGVSACCFWLVGYAVMFGGGQEIFFGLTASSSEIAFFFFQLMFCGTAVTIISGGVAERLKFSGYVIISLFTAVIIYPTFGRWAWLGLIDGRSDGWLGQLGFIDFAGSTVVHAIGGASCLALLLVLGPRTGRFDLETGQDRKFLGSNLPFAALGVILLWVGWFGFNGGSTLVFDAQVSGVLLNTAIAGAAGLLAAMIMGVLHQSIVTTESFLNGPLAGLVAVTASANVVTVTEAFLIGFIGGCVSYWAERWLAKMYIDDAVGAVPVHLGAGIWGSLAVGIFGNPLLLDTGLSWFGQMAVQLLGSAVAFGWAFGMCYIMFTAVNRLFPLRVSEEAEQIGLNVHEHGARTDILDMFLVMDEQAKTGDLSLRVPEEPFTEAGQIANKYNAVLENLEQTIARVQSIVETAQDGIVTFWPETWLIQSGNQAAADIFAIPSSDLLQYRLIDFIAQAIASPQVLMKQGKGKFIEVNGRRADGSTFPMEIAVAQIRSKQTFYYSAIFRDITDRQTFITELSEARDVALQANRVKDQFMGMIGHELRTPIMSISGSAELIEAGTLGEVTESQQEFLAQIIDSSYHLNALVNDIIEQSHLQSGRVRLNLHTFELRPFLEQVLHVLSRLAADKDLEFDCHVDDEMPLTIYNDSTRLNQIITNLASNGIKYTDNGRVTLSIVPVSETHWMLTVSDTGIGISEEDQKKIFDPFQQVENVTTRHIGGFGLGLAIVSQLVTLMRGEIAIESELNQGTSISITLPFE